MPDHRSEAERLLLLADEVEHRSDSITILTHRLARAQAHAMLALADEIRATIDKLAEVVRDA